MRHLSRKIIHGLLALMMVTGVLWHSGTVSAQSDKLQVVATFSIVYDIIREIGGDLVDIHSMVPLGQDPHEYTPLPLDIVKATNADVIFWNGLDMELGDGWFEGLLEVAGKSLDGDSVFELARGLEPMYVSDGGEVEMNPHAYLSIPVAILYAENARDALTYIDPAHADYYDRNAAAYLAKLEDLHKQYVEKLGQIPEERRILVTAERAFQYMAAEYGLKEGYVWAIDTDEQGSPQQILNLIRFVKNNNVHAIFLESNVNPRALETVSRETGVPIVGKLYSDELGRPGDVGGTLLGLLKWNLDTIYEGLMGN